MFHLGLRFLGRLTHKAKSQLGCNRGSISVITIGLFLILLTLFIILTDVSSVYIAKRNLSLTTEAATQRGVKNLDLESYYSGEYNLNRMVSNSIGSGEEDPGIPIDCGAGLKDVSDVISESHNLGFDLSRSNLSGVTLDDFICDGYRVEIFTSAIASLPIPIPFIDISKVHINSYASAIAERAKTNNYYGLDIG